MFSLRTCWQLSTTCRRRHTVVLRKQQIKCEDPKCDRVDAATPANECCGAVQTQRKTTTRSSLYTTYYIRLWRHKDCVLFYRFTEFINKNNHNMWIYRHSRAIASNRVCGARRLVVCDLKLGVLSSWLETKGNARWMVLSRIVCALIDEGSFPLIVWVAIEISQISTKIL